MKTLIKKLLRENLENKTFTPNFIYSYINTLHNEGWEQTDYEDWPWLREHSYFTLDEISLDDNRIKWPLNTPPIYAKETSEYPPIVVSNDGYIMDGMHRAASANKRGDSTIKAYIGHKTTDSMVT